MANQPPRAYLLQHRRTPRANWRDLPREPARATLEEAWARAQELTAKGGGEYRVAAVWPPVAVPAGPDDRQRLAEPPDCRVHGPLTRMTWHAGAGRWICLECERIRADGVPRRQT